MVRTPAGEVVVDPTGRAPGRGAYVCADPACQHISIAKGALRRALEAPIPDGLFAGTSELAASPIHASDHPEGGA